MHAGWVGECIARRTRQIFSAPRGQSALVRRTGRSTSSLRRHVWSRRRTVWRSGSCKRRSDTAIQGDVPMRLRLNAFFPAIALLITSACGADVEFGLFTQEPGKFAEIPGRLCILIANNQDRWKLELANGQLKANASCNERGVADSGASPQRAQVQAYLPKEPGIEYRGPWSLAVDKSLVAASFTRRGENSFVEDKFVIVNVSAKRVIARVELKPAAFAVAMSWSPSSKRLAVLYGEEKKGRCGRGGLGAISGHPVRCLTFGVAIFDDQGSKVAQTEIARGIPGGGGVIGWLK